MATDKNFYTKMRKPNAKYRQKYPLSPILPDPEKSIKVFNHINGTGDSEGLLDSNASSADVEATGEGGAAMGEDFDTNEENDFDKRWDKEFPDIGAKLFTIEDFFDEMKRIEDFE